MIFCNFVHYFQQASDAVALWERSISAAFLFFGKNGSLSVALMVLVEATTVLQSLSSRAGCVRTLGRFDPFVFLWLVWQHIVKFIW